MKRRRPRLPNGVEIPVTPLIDIVFLLLIYFLLTSHFVKQQTLKVRLPESKTGQVLREEVLTVTIGPGGRFWVNGELTPQDKLKEAIEQASLRTGAQRVHIEADREATVRLLVMAMDAVKEAGLKEILVKTISRQP